MRARRKCTCASRARRRFRPASTAWTRLRKNQLIAANKSVEEIREYIGADSLAYLSLEGLSKACGEGEKTNYCTACYTGKYPTNWVDVEEIQPAVAKS